jgi:ribose 5-phosphate isomerase B
VPSDLGLDSKVSCSRAVGLFECLGSFNNLAYDPPSGEMRISGRTLKEVGLTMKVYFASDHAGFEAKNRLIEYVRDHFNCEVEDCGALVNDPQDDYLGIIAVAARKLSEDVAAGKDSRAIVAGASGQGEAIVANRFEGVRCALYYGDPGDEQMDASGKKLDILMSTREHNDANALSLGLRFLTLDQAKQAVTRWLAAPFSGEARHARRITQIDQVSSGNVA